MAENPNETAGLTYWYDSSTRVLEGGEALADSESVLAAIITDAVLHAQTTAAAVGIDNPEIRVIIRTEWTKPIDHDQEDTNGD